MPIRENISPSGAPAVDADDFGEWLDEDGRAAVMEVRSLRIASEVGLVVGATAICLAMIEVALGVV